MGSGVEGKMIDLRDSIPNYLEFYRLERKTEDDNIIYNRTLDILELEKLFGRIAAKFEAELQNTIDYFTKN